MTAGVGWQRLRYVKSGDYMPGTAAVRAAQGGRCLSCAGRVRSMLRPYVNRIDVRGGSAASLEQDWLARRLAVMNVDASRTYLHPHIMMTWRGCKSLSGPRVVGKATTFPHTIHTLDCASSFEHSHRTPHDDFPASVGFAITCQQFDFASIACTELLRRSTCHNHASLLYAG